MKNFCSLQKFQILHRSRTIKLPIKTPRPDKILEKKWEFENLIDFGVLSIIYPQSLKSFKFVNSPQGTSRKGGSNRVQIWIKFEKFFKFESISWCVQFECAQFCFKFFQNFIQLCTKFLQFFDVRGKKYFCIAFFLAIFCKKLHFVDMCPRSKFSHFSMFFHRFFFNAPPGIICSMRASELREEAKKSNRQLLSCGTGRHFWRDVYFPDRSQPREVCREHAVDRTITEDELEDFFKARGMRWEDCAQDREAWRLLEQSFAHAVRRV